MAGFWLGFWLRRPGFWLGFWLRRPGFWLRCWLLCVFSVCYPCVLCVFSVCYLCVLSVFQYVLCMFSVCSRCALSVFQCVLSVISMCSRCVLSPPNLLSGYHVVRGVIGIYVELPKPCIMVCIMIIFSGTSSCFIYCPPEAGFLSGNPATATSKTSNLSSLLPAAELSCTRGRRPPSLQV